MSESPAPAYTVNAWINPAVLKPWGRKGPASPKKAWQLWLGCPGLVGGLAALTGPMAMAMTTMPSNREVISFL